MTKVSKSDAYAMCRDVYFDAKEPLWEYILGLKNNTGLTKEEILDLLENMTWRAKTWIKEDHA